MAFVAKVKGATLNASFKCETVEQATNVARRFQHMTAPDIMIEDTNGKLYRSDQFELLQSAWCK